ncbi:MAG: hypothetical protein RIB98_10855 [Acidimicrobiales bacterium]
MRLILHIGTAKTGTSSIQASMHLHSETWKRAGVLYPTPPKRKTNHNLLAVLCQEEHRYPREFLQGGSSPSDVRHLAERWWRDMTSELKNSRGSTVVLSGEYLFGMNEGEVERLAEVLIPLFDEIEVVVYFRDPASYYLSFVQQRVRAAAVLPSPAKFRLRAEICVRRHAEALRSTVTARSFDRTALIGGDIVTDFTVSVLGISPEEAASFTVENQNASFSAEAMCIMQMVRRHVHPDQEDRRTAASLRLMSELRQLGRDIPQTVPRLRPEISAAIARSHERDLEYLAAQFSIRFDHIVEPLAADDPDPDGWESGELTTLLEVEPESLSRTVAHLLVRASFA